MSFGGIGREPAVDPVGGTDASSAFPGMSSTKEEEMALVVGVTSSSPVCSSDLDSTVKSCDLEEEANPEGGKDKWLDGSGPG